MQLNLISAVVRAITFFTFGIATLWAQTFQGGLRGIVEDPGGSAIAGAKVVLLNQATNVSRVTDSNAQGEYVFSSVDPATYAIVVESSGFKKLQHKDVVVGTQQFVTVDLKLELGSINESVQVTAEVALIETSNASNGQVMDSQKITDLPNLGRNVFLLAKLSNNVVPAGDPRWNRFQDQSGSSQISIAGGPIRGNNYLIDGIPVTDSTNRAVIIPSLESTAEMKLQTGTYDATMGRTGGGVFNTLLKSGTNDWHGDVFGYLRQTDWTANNFFYNANGTPRPSIDFKTWGGGFGGPVVIPKVYNGRNRTFFYVATEAYRQHSPYADQYALPTAQERAGDYSQSSVKVYDPLTSRACTPTDNCPSGVTVVREPFGDNRIPKAKINGVGAAILSYLPLPARVTPTDSFNYTGTTTLFDRADQYTYKLEHNFAQWFRATGSFMYYKSREPGGNTLGTLPGGSSQAPYLLYRRVDATAVNAIFTLNPTTVLTARYGFNRFPNIFSEVSEGFSPGTLGLPASYVNAIQALYFPQINFLNAPAISSQSPSWTVYWSKNMMVSVSKYIGRHSISAGFDYRLIHTDFINLASSAGNFTFNGVFSRQYPTTTNGTGADFADALLGYPSAGSVATATKFLDFVRYYSGYVQDDIRVNNKLTVNVGLRYEYETGVAESNNHFVSGFDRGALSPLAAGVTGIQPHGVIQFAGVNGNPTACCSPSRKKFGPRVGVAYQLNDKTTVRGGWGLFYAPFIFSNSATTAPGFSQTTTYVASNDGNSTPANSLSNPFPSGVLQPVGTTLGALTAVGSSFNLFDNTAQGGRVQQFSVDVQRELGYGIALEVGYVGSRSKDLQPHPTSSTPILNINQLDPQFFSMGSALNNRVTNPFFGKLGAGGVIGSSTVAQVQLLLPFPQYTTIGAIRNTSHAQYDSLIVKVQKRLAQGLTFLSTVTWSKNMDNEFGSVGSNSLNGFSSSPPTQPQNVYNLDGEWALAATNTPVRFTGTWTYTLPFGKSGRFLTSNRMLDYLVGGWQINGTVVLQSGFPLFIYQQNLNSVTGAGAQRPNATGVSPAMQGSVEDRVNGYINPAAFSQAPAFTFGNLSRSIPYRGPGQANWDSSVFKNIKIGGERGLNAQFRAEALNTFNTPLFASPNTQFGTPSFGKLTYQANLPRQLQLGLRFQF
jgi:hypothetical protein